MIGAALSRRPRRLCVSETPTYFARKLTELREAAGLSKYRLAQLVGISHQALSMMESGQRGPSWDTVQKLALILDVDCAVFIDPGLQLPEVQPPKKAGRPRKESGERPEEGPKRKGRGKGK